MSKFLGVKTNNANNISKIKIRENVLIEFTEEVAILDIFCGSGEMYYKVYSNAENYTGIDIIKQDDNRHTICGDSITIMKCLDLNKYNFFDIDAYGSPYEELSLILKSIDTNTYKEYAFVITDGLDIDLRMGKLANSLIEILDIDIKKIKNAHKLHDIFIKKIVKKIILKFKNIEYTKFFITKGITGSGMRYYSVFIKQNIA